MNYRTLGKTGFRVSEISLGADKLGGGFGKPFDFAISRKILETAFDNGINFIDTADVYCDTLSEKAIGEFIKSHQGEIFVATKCGRMIHPHTSENYSDKNIRQFIEGSLKRLDVEVIDLLQLHCPTLDVYENPQVWETLDALKSEGKILHYGTSLEQVGEGLLDEAEKALRTNIATIQVNFNMLCNNAADLFFEKAKKMDIGIIAKVPLATGLLSGKLKKDTQFSDGDHRKYNLNGDIADYRGVTFTGIDYESGLLAVEELKKLFGTENLAPIALRWILMFDEVSTIIPGVSNPDRIYSNIQATDLAVLSQEQMLAITKICKEFVRSQKNLIWA